MPKKNKFLLEEINAMKEEMKEGRVRVKELNERGEEVGLDVKEEHDPGDPRSIYEVEELLHLGFFGLYVENGEMYIQRKR